MTQTRMLSLEARKMEKNFIGVMEKGYSRKPQNAWSLKDWIKRLEQEIEELKPEIEKMDHTKIMDELADLSNIIDFMFENALKDSIIEKIKFAREIERSKNK